MLKSLAFLVIATAAGVAAGTCDALADHPCDPVAEPGWTIVPSHETVEQSDSAPYQDGGNWVVERTTTVLPYCSYFDAIGIYSMRSYSLSPETTKARIAICQRTPAGGSEPIPPYAGPCPPK